MVSNARSSLTPDADAAASRRRRIARVIATLAFLALIGAPVALRYRSARSTAAAAPADAGLALARYGFVLREVSADAGIRFVHRAPALDPVLDPIMPVVASLGAAVSVADFDRDGWPDLYVTSSAIGSSNGLFRNRGDGSFEDVAGALGIADVNAPGAGVSMGAVWGDYDNDGFEDLFLYRWGRPELFHNDGGRGFTRVTDQIGLPAWINANTAVWFDYDRDGWIDLFVGGFYPAEVNLWQLESTRVMPESFEFAQNGGRNYLFRNRGDGTFEEVGEALGLTTRRWTLAAAAADVNGDGWPDLFVANDFGINELYINEAGVRFREIGRTANIGRTPKSGMNAAFGDVLNRGEWGLFVTNIAEPGVLMHGNDLWLPASAKGETPAYRNLAGAMGVELAGWSYGAQFGDLNNDGWLDLVVTNGMYSGASRDSYWYDYSLVAGGNRSIIADARNWPAVRDRSLSGYQQDLVLRNDGAGRFQDVTHAVGAANQYDGRAVAFADLWNRGVLDVIAANQRGPLLLYRNTVSSDHGWITFQLQGTRSNRSAIGAEIRLFWADKEQVQQIDGGSGFASQSQRRAHFGLGRVTQVDSAVIRWPSGHVQTLLTPGINRLHAITEPQ